MRTNLHLRKTSSVDFPRTSDGGRIVSKSNECTVESLEIEKSRLRVAIGRGAVMRFLEGEATVNEQVLGQCLPVLRPSMIRYTPRMINLIRAS